MKTVEVHVVVRDEFEANILESDFLDLLSEVGGTCVGIFTRDATYEEIDHVELEE